jgi:nucleotide-binding universal stress UspA family protein
MQVVSANGAELFPRVVCGVDGSAAGEEAVRQALLLSDPRGQLVLVSVAMVTAGAHPQSVLALRSRATAVLEAAGRVAGGRAVDRRVVEAEPVSGLLAAAEHDRATLLAVGSHGIGRVAGILTGSVATAVVHRAHCSVLIARAGGSAGPFPSRIVVGVDGSALSLEAVWVAQRLAERVGAKLELIAAAGAAAGSADPQVYGLGEVSRDERDPVVALLAACDDAALLVVGSRGLGGVRALGSVSERVAHRAPVSVLVVRSGEPGAARYAGTAD